MKGKKILLVHTHFSTFVRQDYEILSKNNTVYTYHFVSKKNPLRLLAEFLKQSFYLLIRGWQYDVFFIWFASYHSLLPTLFAKITRKKTIVVIGGYDSTRVQSLKYGAFYNKKMYFFTIYTIRNSTVNLCVSRYVHRIVSKISPRSNNMLVYNCIEFSSQSTSGSKENIVLTVASVQSSKSFYIKGLDTFIDTARAMPEYEFYIVGLNQKTTKEQLGNLPKNLTIQGFKPHSELIDIYKRAKVYCQLSRMESFCLALAEAMHFGCYPVTTNVGALPEVTGKLGCSTARDLKSILDAIKQGMNAPHTDEFSDFISQNFSMQKRADSLNGII